MINDKRNYIIFSGGLFIVGLIMFLRDRDESTAKTIDYSSNFGGPNFASKPMNDLSVKNFADLNKSPRVSAEVISPLTHSQAFTAIEKDLSNDAYKLYLAEKYKITRNDLFKKFVYEQKMYDDLNDLLEMVHKLEVNFSNELEVNGAKNLKDLKIIGDEEKKYFFEQNSFLIRNLSSKGYPVSSFGTYPSIRWTISLKNGQTKRISSLEELSIFNDSI